MTVVPEKETLLKQDQENPLENDFDKNKNGKSDSGICNKLKGIICALADAVCNAVSSTCVQLLERRIPDLELNTFRNAIPLVLYAIVFLLMRRWPVIERGKIGITLLYTVVTFVCATLFFIAVSLLPAATATTTFSTTFIVFGLFIFSLCWNEQITLSNVLYATLCVSGVTLVIQPWVLRSRLIGRTSLTNHVAAFDRVAYLNGNNVTNLSYAAYLTDLNANNTNRSNNGCREKKDSNEHAVLENTFSDGFVAQIIGYIFAALSGFTFSLDVLLVKRNPYFNDNILDVVFWIFVSNTCFSVIIMFILETPVLPSNWFDTAMVTFHCLSYAAIWPLYIYAPKYISGSTVTAIISTEVLFMLISQYTVLSSILPGHKNWMEIVGVILVMLGSSLSSLVEVFKNKQL